jgi:hypothetical protein
VSVIWTQCSATIYGSINKCVFVNCYYVEEQFMIGHLPGSSLKCVY